MLAQPDPKFEAFRKKLADAVSRRAASMINAEYAVPYEDFGASADVGVHAQLDRSSLADTYVKAFTDDTLDMATAIALTAQHEIMAAAEKAVTMRRRNRLGFMIGGTSKSYGQSQPTGLLDHGLKQLAVSESQ